MNIKVTRSSNFNVHNFPLYFTYKIKSFTILIDELMQTYKNKFIKS